MHCPPPALDFDLISSQVAVGDRGYCEIFFVGGIGQPPLRCLPDLRLLGVAGREPLGQQDLVGGRAQVAAQLPGGDPLEDAPEQLLELRDHVKGEAPITGL